MVEMYEFAIFLLLLYS